MTDAEALELVLAYLEVELEQMQEGYERRGTTPRPVFLEAFGDPLAREAERTLEPSWSRRPTVEDLRVVDREDDILWVEATPG